MTGLVRRCPLRDPLQLSGVQRFLRAALFLIASRIRVVAPLISQLLRHTTPTSFEGAYVPDRANVPHRPSFRTPTLNRGYGSPCFTYIRARHPHRTRHATLSHKRFCCNASDDRRRVWKFHPEFIRTRINRERRYFGPTRYNRIFCRHERCNNRNDELTRAFLRSSKDVLKTQSLEIYIHVVYRKLCQVHVVGSALVRQNFDRKVKSAAECEI